MESVEADVIAIPAAPAQRLRLDLTGSDSGGHQPSEGGYAPSDTDQTAHAREAWPLFVAAGGSGRVVVVR